MAGREKIQAPAPARRNGRLPVGSEGASPFPTWQDDSFHEAWMYFEIEFIKSS